MSISIKTIVCKAVLSTMAFFSPTGAVASYAQDCPTDKSDNTANRLWYQTPAKEWMEGIPLGNGRIGAIVFGGISKERIALNEVTLWSGQRDTGQNDGCGPERLREIRETFFKGDIPGGNELTRKYLSGHSKSFGTHLPLGEITVSFDYQSRQLYGYRRELNLETGLATTTYRMGDVTYTREYICDYPDDILAVRFTADKPGAITARFKPELLRKSTYKADNGGISFEGKVDYPMFGPGGVEFAGRFQLIVDGGSIIVADTVADVPTVSVRSANSVTMLFDIRTDMFSEDYRDILAENMRKAGLTGWEQMRKNHVEDVALLFNRMSIRLGNDEAKADIPTDVRLRLVKGGAVDTGFDALFFQYGRYMQIASSRPKSPLASNLQGIWNDNLACHMSWTCDYHLDININQNYWSSNKANLAECNTPLVNYVRLLAKYGSETARKLYGCRGWCAHTVTNPWGYTAPGGDVSWGLNVTGGAWLATELWSHYLYTLDKEWLRTEGYPLLRQTAEFFMDYMVEDPQSGYLVTGPSISPENGFRWTDGNGYSASMMPTLDRCVVYQIYDACIKAAKILDVDKGMAARLQKDIKRLPPIMTGKDGQIKEWLLDVGRTDPSHRHSSHIMGLYPFGQMSWTRTPELMAAARKALETQTADPSWENTEWSCGNMLGFYAFLRDGNACHSWLQELFRAFTRENLMTVSPKGVALAPEDIFSFDATEASVAAICDILLQSHDGAIEFLPALPDAWKDGEVKGLCAQGAVTADLQWQDGRLERAVLHAQKDTKVDVVIPEGMGRKAGKTRFSMKAGEQIVIE